MVTFYKRLEKAARPKGKMDPDEAVQKQSEMIEQARPQDISKEDEAQPGRAATVGGITGAAIAGAVAAAAGAPAAVAAAALGALTGAGLGGAMGAERSEAGDVVAPGYAPPDERNVPPGQHVLEVSSERRPGLEQAEQEARSGDTSGPAVRTVHEEEQHDKQGTQAEPKTRLP